MSEHAVILRIPLSDEAFGQEDERERYRELGDALEDRLSSPNEYDGHEFGGGECVMWSYGPDADALLEQMQPVLASASLPVTAVVIKRYGPAGDDNVRQVETTL